MPIKRIKPVDQTYQVQSLGPDFQNPEYQRKMQNLQKTKEYSQRIKQMNSKMKTMSMQEFQLRQTKQKQENQHDALERINRQKLYSQTLKINNTQKQPTRNHFIVPPVVNQQKQKTQQEKIEELYSEHEQLQKQLIQIQEKYNQVVEFAKSRPDSDFYLNNQKLNPKPELIFEAIKNMDKAKVVILGQDPYPNPDSACGIAFLDNKIKSFQDKSMAPSLKNLLKSLLIDTGKAYQEDSYQEIREKLLKEFKSQKPQDFFASLQRQGFMFLNTSLTYESKETTQKHCKWWAPVISKIFKLYTDKDTVLILMGSYAQSYYNTYLRALNIIKPNRIIKTCHPVLQNFTQEQLFKRLNNLCKDIDYFN